VRLVGVQLDVQSLRLESGVRQQAAQQHRYAFRTRLDWVWKEAWLSQQERRRHERFDAALADQLRQPSQQVVGFLVPR
jgi:hypothetical protein